MQQVLDGLEGCGKWMRVMIRDSCDWVLGVELKGEVGVGGDGVVHKKVPSAADYSRQRWVGSHKAYKMSTHADDEPTGRVRRKTALPARYEDYDLTGFVLPTLHPEPVSSHTQIPSNLSDDEEQEEGTTAFSLLQIPVDETQSSDKWSDTDSGRSENALLKQRNRILHYANENMLHTVKVVERDILQQTNQHYAQQLSQLKQQMQQLQTEVSQQGPAAQPQPHPSKPIPAPRHRKNMQAAEKSLRPVPTLRFKRDSFSSQEETPALAAAPRDKLYTPYEATSAQPFSKGVAKEEESYHRGCNYPLYDQEHAASTPYDSAWRHQMPYGHSPSLLFRSPHSQRQIETQLIRVGGRLRHSTHLERDTVHPIVLDAKHPITQLIIQSYEAKLHHPGYDRVFAELRRKYWILRGREAVKRFQRSCVECQKWRKSPEIPKMADLPPPRLRLFRPAFYSTGMDCFGPYAVKVGRRTEKKWGIISVH
ncbi:hypothetical protein QQF64_013547 [Cirrhinus molitorella]|uniref:Integrase zinc-binding domain-containing protein n=1 Tax=Cirrhinus molitorella TaxID=172907 RepID=A0ABR3LRH4_9TELE